MSHLHRKASSGARRGDRVWGLASHQCLWLEPMGGFHARPRPIGEPPFYIRGGSPIALVFWQKRSAKPIGEDFHFTDRSASH